MRPGNQQINERFRYLKDQKFDAAGLGNNRVYQCVQKHPLHIKKKMSADYKNIFAEYALVKWGAKNMSVRLLFYQIR